MHLQSRNLHYLCALFQSLVNSAPSGTIFCLIDDFKALEYQSMPESLLRAFQCIQDLVIQASQGSRITFKVLIATPPQDSIFLNAVQWEVCSWLRAESERGIGRSDADAERIMYDMGSPGQECFW